MATTEISVPALLTTLVDSLSSAHSSLPQEHSSLLPPTDGISLLDTKNSLLLSYIQNLVFLVILKLRQTTGNKTQDAEAEVSAAAIRKLVELRVYMERGVRPLEGRLKYQIDKVLRAADDAERADAAKTAINGVKRSKKATGGEDYDSDISESDSQAPISKPSDLSYRPNPAALLRMPDPSSHATKSSSTSRLSSSAAYKPPRITPTSMPQPSQSSNSASRDNLGRRHHKSHLLDEYVSAELSSAPLAEPSIGSNSTILNRGRGSLSARQRAQEKERTEYEERNLARLPGESRAEKRKARARGEGAQRNVYGGEQWVELGAVGDRVARSVARGKVGDGGARGGVLERREKRMRDDGDERRGGGVGIGETFEKRRRVLEGRAQKKKRSG